MSRTGLKFCNFSEGRVFATSSYIFTIKSRDTKYFRNLIIIHERASQELLESLYAIVNGSCAFRHVRPPYLFQAPEISFNINIGHMNI